MVDRKLRPVLATALAVTWLAGCGAGVGADDDAAGEPAPAAHLIEVSAEDYAFRVPAEIPSGWVTMRFRNNGDEHHFMFLSRLPAGRTLDEYVTDVGVPFNEVWYRLKAGEIDKQQAMEQIGQAIPEWFWSVEQMGGSGLVAPGRTSELTVRLEPGNYVVECYMKTAEGEFHALEGMTDPLTVTAARTDAAPPEADIHVMLSNFQLTVTGELTAGRRTVAVHVAEQPEVGFGHNLHLARLADDAEVERILAWLDWMNRDGLQEPAPAHFLGGIHVMPAGYTGYFTVDLEPGRHLLVSEYTGSQGVLKEVTIR